MIREYSKSDLARIGTPRRLGDGPSQFSLAKLPHMQAPGQPGMVPGKDNVQLSMSSRSRSIGDGPLLQRIGVTRQTQAPQARGWNTRQRHIPITAGPTWVGMIPNEKIPT